MHNSEKQATVPPDKIDTYLDEELEETIGIKDYEIDRIKFESSLLFKNPEWKNGLTRATRYADRFVLGWSVFLFILLIGFCCWYMELYVFVYCYLLMQGLLLYWRFFLSPVRTQAFSTPERFMRYRGFLQHGPNMKAHIRDRRYAFLLFIYLLWNAMVFASMHHAWVDDITLRQVNNIIFDRGQYPDSLVNSLIPALVVMGVAVNIYGAMVAAKYYRLSPETGAKLSSARVQKGILIIVAVSLFGLFIIAGVLGNTYSAFWATEAGEKNWLWLFDDEDPLYHARATIIIYYFAIFAGSTFVAWLIMLGFSAFELGGVRLMVDHLHETMEPPEQNWEFKGTLERQEKARKDMIHTRKASLAEILIMCVAMVVGMWLFLYWGGSVVQNEQVNNIMNILGYVVIGLAALWAFFVSQLYHAKKDGTYFYPTPKQNVHYVAWDERGMGSWKYYYREVWGKKIGVQAWIIMWVLFCATLYILDWEGMWQGAPASGLIVDLTQSFLNPNDVTVASVLISGILATIGFIVALQLRKEDMGNSMFWCNLYKIMMAVIVYCHIRWISMIPQITVNVNLFSLPFLKALGVIVLLYTLATVVMLTILMPLVVKFDNLAVARKEILIILLNTVLLSVVMMVLFQALLPMTDVNGTQIYYGYPWRGGEENEVKYYWEHFELANLLREIGARYVWWGGLQQYLFMSYFLNIWRKVFPKSKGYLVACGTSMIFGVIHAIDWPLMLCTGIMGLLWAYFWQKEYYDENTGKVHHGNNLLLWGLVHGFGGSLLGMILPFGMGVGPFNM